MDGISFDRRSWIQALLATLPGLGARSPSLKEERVNEAFGLLQSAVRKRILRSASLHVRGDSFNFHKAAGEASPGTVFLIASITKPLTAAGVLLLVDANELKLSDPVQRFIPEFREGMRKRITIRHLLTHTSGLPDQLPENIELRKRRAPLEEFVQRAIRTPLLFEPGKEVRYQSMGFLLAAEVVQRITNRPFRKFLKEKLFLPLGMKNTELGLGQFRIADTAQSQVEEAPELYGGGSDTSRWNWNSPYWRDLGAPWGGAHSNGFDLQLYLRYFLSPDGSVLRKETAQAMIRNQNQGLDIPWGLGFMVETTGLGAFCSPLAYGHSGSTGTLCWADPQTGASMVLLTTLPARVSRKTLLEPVSDLVGQAFA